MCRFALRRRGALTINSIKKMTEQLAAILAAKLNLFNEMTFFGKCQLCDVDFGSDSRLQSRLAVDVLEVALEAVYLQSAN